MHVIYFSLIWQFVSIGTAHAYIDLGTGSYMLQILIGALAAAGFFVKQYWARIKKMFRKK
jgi:hypothetical protein